MLQTCSEQLRKKLDDKSTLQIMIRYHNTSGYKVYDPISKNVVVSRDVYVDESTNWDWIENTKYNSALHVVIEEESSADQEDSTEQNVTKTGRVSQLPSCL